MTLALPAFLSGPSGTRLVFSGCAYLYIAAVFVDLLFLSATCTHVCNVHLRVPHR